MTTREEILHTIAQFYQAWKSPESDIHGHIANSLQMHWQRGDVVPCRAPMPFNHLQPFKLRSAIV